MQEVRSVGARDESRLLLQRGHVPRRAVGELHRVSLDKRVKEKALERELVRGPFQAQHQIVTGREATAQIDLRLHFDIARQDARRYLDHIHFSPEIARV